MTIDVFDPDFYFDLNPDLGAAGLATDAELLNHFNTVGLNEGRPFSPLVDLNLYKNSNSDLTTAGLTSNSQLLDHLENFGVDEGRNFSPVFDVNYYRQIYADLQAAGLDNEQLFQHFLNNGINEGRVGSANFDVNFYLNSNTDLQAVGFTKVQALDHYVALGMREGRRGSASGGSSGGGGSSSSDNLLAAVDLGNLTGTQTRTDFVGTTDSSDIYRFVLNTTSNFSISLSGLSADADVDFVQDFNGNGVINFEEVIDGGVNAGTSSEAINRNSLAAGTYFVRVFQDQGVDTNYNLSVSATPV